MNGNEPLPLGDMRLAYGQTPLLERDLDPDPIRQFQAWLKEAAESGIMEPNAMTLATASPGGTVTSRMVLLKGVDEQGFRFYTNYDSDKARQLAANAHASLLFFWDKLARQVRVTGAASRLGRQESEAYFATRPRESQIGAWASAQSAVISGRDVLEENFRRWEEKFRGQPVPAPPNWGGYCVKPDMIEFWQGRDARMHDRLRYRREVASGKPSHWVIERLSP